MHLLDLTQRRAALAEVGMRYFVSLGLALALGVMPMVGCNDEETIGGTGGAGGAIGQEFPCTEQGIRDAIALGGGPHTFDCGDGTTVVTEATIVIDSDVILDGEGNLTVDGNDSHTVFSVLGGVTAELHGMVVTGGFSIDGEEQRSAAIHNAGTLTMIETTVSGNRSGWGIVFNSGTLSMMGVTVSSNACGGACPTISNAGTLTMTNCTVSGNQFGAGISSSGTLTMTNCTVVDAGAAIRIGDGALLSIVNTVVVGACDVSFTSGIASFGFNIESPGDTCRLDEGNQVNIAADQLNLGPLQDNGGPTKTHALLTEPAVSVAIETGACPWDANFAERVPNTDQRGVVRPQGDRCDVGAFELEQDEACRISAMRCTNGEVEPIEPICEIVVPEQPNACDGTESLENPTSCTPSDITVTHELTKMQVAADCNTGYDLDGCVGSSCWLGGLTQADGANGVDNGLGSSAGVWNSFSDSLGTPGDLGSLDQAFHDSICTGAINIELEVDAVPEEGCALVRVSSAGVPGDAVPMNLSDDGCLSGALGTIPIQIGDVDGSIENAVVRMTLSAQGFSDGILGGTADLSTAGAMADAIAEGASAIAPQFFDINADLSVDWQVECDAQSLTLEIGGTNSDAGTGGSGGIAGGQ